MHILTVKRIQCLLTVRIVLSQAVVVSTALSALPEPGLLFILQCPSAPHQQLLLQQTVGCCQTNILFAEVRICTNRTFIGMFGKVTVKTGCVCRAAKHQEHQRRGEPSQ